MPIEWHEDDDLYAALAPLYFNEDRIRHARREAGHVIDLLMLEGGARVLDLACGIGRHSLELSRRGFEVTALDRTSQYIDTAREMALVEGLDFEFIVGDMRTFERSASFDAIINMRTSFGMFDDPSDDLKVARNVCANLVDGGALLIEMIGREILERGFSGDDEITIDDVTYRESRSLAGDGGSIVNRLTIEGPEGPIEIDYSYRLYSKDSITRLLRHVGFRDVSVFGGLDGRPYDEGAVNLVAVGRK